MLSLLKKKLVQKKEMHVCYLGGSITEGAGATIPALRWSSRIHGWFEKTYPEIEWKEFNAGIGGTNSELGIFRLQADVLIHKPDLVFVEFAVNDYRAEEAQCLNAMEAIVRNIKLSQPEAEIIFIITAMVAMDEECYSKGMLPRSVQIHEKVAQWYQIPVIHVGQALLQKIHTEMVDSSVYLMDGVHPNDNGYALYYEVIRAYIEKALLEADEHCLGNSLPEMLGDGRYRNAHMVSAIEAADTEFRREAVSLLGRTDGYISSDVAGAKGTVEFTGTGIGVFWGICSDSGILEYQLDGGKVQKASSWDKYALGFDRCNHKMLAAGLEEGKHVLKFGVSEEKEEQSKGQFIRIGAFLIM